ncbi:penicillin-binding protein activator [Herbaspirillum rhizosphaerae]|uniref:penicillin-binding protein activator n=1 Tax=Herbaspirillum rhizosphaerae TaxID=346179 RepID=UPI00067E5424|nr:penicillin-binding protein activator [Herbaspirillum rhizosphaerae]
MLGKWAKVILLTALLSGLCASVQAFTTVGANDAAPAPSAAPASAPAASAAAPATDFSLPPENSQPPVRVALLLPLRSSVFGAAADAVRTGFLTASERKKDNLVITIIETGDSAQEALNAYNDASGKYDIIVGPLSRSAVTALVQSAAVRKPTIALAQPDLPDTADQRLPRQMIMMGLSIEEEARQVAAWVEHEKTPGKIFAISTNIAWQRRAVKAFVQQARQQGMAVENLELSVPNNALSATGLAQLGQRIQAEKPALLFVALDAAQTIQLRSAIGNEIALYGTSQLNPLTLASATAAVNAAANNAAASAATGTPPAPDNRLPELDGVRLVDMPWQLQADNAAVMAYPRSVANADVKPNADLERLYALGIDAFRVANEIAQRRSGFDIDGVTGQINVNMAAGATYFQRKETQAVYQDGIAVPVANQR